MCDLKTPIQSGQGFYGKTSFSAGVAKQGTINSHLQLGVRSDPTELNGLGVRERKFPKRKSRCCFRKKREGGLSKQRVVITVTITRRLCEVSHLLPSIRPLASL